MRSSNSSLEEILNVEYKVNNKNNNISERINIIYNFDVIKYADLEDIVNSLPSNYIEPLLGGLEAQILAEISKAKIKRRTELKIIQNKNLRIYEEGN